VIGVRADGVDPTPVGQGGSDPVTGKLLTVNEVIGLTPQLKI
jgi:hypothetical protein